MEFLFIPALSPVKYNATILAVNCAMGQAHEL